MPINVKKNQKSIAIELRKKGLSYGEIQKELALPKATLASWLKNLKLTDEQLSRLQKKRSDTARANAIRRTERIVAETNTIIASASANIKNISKRELWLMGVMLYWTAKQKHDQKHGVHFMSSDPELIKLFLLWLKDIGGIKYDEIAFDIFLKSDTLKERESAIAYWKKIIGTDLFNLYIQKARRRRGLRNTVKRAESSILRIRVRKSSLLARQITGWIQGIKTYIN